MGIGKPLPYSGAARMINLTVLNENGNNWWVSLTGRTQALKDAKCIESLAASQGTWNLNDHGRRSAEDVPSVWLTGKFGAYFGVPALLGRSADPFRHARRPGPAAVVC